MRTIIQRKNNVPSRERVRCRVLPAQVEQVDCVAGCVAGGRHALRRAGRQVVLGQLDRRLQIKRRLDKGGHKARGDVPLNVAVEEPDA